ncbi:tripeptidyl-peptidase 2 [Coccinella septempunctata]|uniref:tripeptidyl-peptidase 2 n=1 Tax=Coccinella septempunctata TaxID=41139 RepID=UPI001D066A89|nr:tripeptidyl-peptidase 2 [Coccinella septempunctata]
MTTLEEFPTISLLPKKETGVYSFLTKYPEYDGRGTTIAILDSGVDPGAPGLQTTTEGHRKVIHRFDCSGCGDVCTITSAQPSDGIIIGLTGRKLHIPEDWKNPTNTYRIGLKHAYCLFSESLRKQMRQKNKEKCWDTVNRDILAKTRRELAAYDGKDSSLSDAERMKKEDLEARLEMLLQFEKKMVDPGPVYDCLLFHDGEMWRCCVDTSEIGNLKECRVLGEYSKTGDYAPLTKESNLNYSFNVHDDGDTLELVGLCSIHGTLVAAIASAHFPDKPEENGVAPGAKIISLSIGDGRLGSMETGTALVRAMIKVMELSRTENIHVINMSYGEHSHWSDTGRIGELMLEVVDKYGITWVASAGNHGPALNTVGTPPDISQEVLIGVGAYVSPEMMLAAYSMRQKLPGMLYTWSSRGPTIDGGMGVTVCAPGGAIAPSPNFTLTYSQLCNGTSMSSPHTAGAISLIISGLIKRNLPFSPYSIKRAIEASATFLPEVEVFVQGSGLLNVEKTFDHLVNYHDAKELNVRFDITCGNNNRKGIISRNKMRVQSFCDAISIEPHFLKSDSVPAQEKINFNLRLALTCDASFIDIPSHLDLSNTTRMITVKVNTGGLKPGVHSSWIKAYDRSNIEKGPLFKVPTTVIIPEELNKPKYNLTHTDVLFEANTIKRHFIHVPNLATWFQLHLSTKSEESSKFVVHVLQILSRKSCKTIDSYESVVINSQTEATLAFNVIGGATVEIVIAKFWSDIGSAKLDYNIVFRGIKPSTNCLTMHSGDGVLGLEVATLQGEEITPSLVLTTAIQVVRPSEGKIAALTRRDLIPYSRQIYELVLVYNFSISKSLEISPNFAPLSDVLYEGEFESQMWMLYDSNKQLKGIGDAYPSKYSVKIDKGEYVIRCQVRHEKLEYLEKLSESPILIHQKMSNPIAVDLYTSYSSAIVSNKKTTGCSTSSSMVVNLYIAPIPNDKLPKLNAQYLMGRISFVKDEAAKKVDTYPFKYILTEGNNKKNTSNNETSAKLKLEEANEQIRDMKIQMLLKLDPADAEKMFEDLNNDKAASTSASLYSTFLTVIDPLEPKTSLPSFKTNDEDKSHKSTSRVISICDKILNMVDADALLIHSAIKTDSKADSAKNKKMEAQKTALIEALCHKGIAKCRLAPETDTEESKSHLEVTEIWKSLGRFVDLNDSTLKSAPANILYFLIWYSHLKKCHGKTFKYLWRLQEDQKNKLIEEKLIDLSVLVGWPHVEKHLRRTIVSKFSDDYQLF